METAEAGFEEDACEVAHGTDFTLTGDAGQHVAVAHVKGRAGLVCGVAAVHGYKGFGAAGLARQALAGLERAVNAFAGYKVSTFVHEGRAGLAGSRELFSFRVNVNGSVLLPTGDEILSVLDEVVHLKRQEALRERLGFRHARRSGGVVHGSVVGYDPGVGDVRAVGTDGDHRVAVHVEVRAGVARRGRRSMDQNVFLSDIAFLIPEVPDEYVGHGSLSVTDDGGPGEVHAGLVFDHIVEVQVLEVLQAGGVDLAVHVEGVACEHVGGRTAASAAIECQIR